MNILWLGHGSFRIEIGDQILLIDPWINGNPMMEGQDSEAALAGATQILVTHGHFDHTQDIVEVSERTGAPVTAIYELAHYLFSKGAKEGHAFNKGGTLTFGDVSVNMVPASHSSSIKVGDRAVYMGAEIGFIIRGEGKTLYFSGDTTVMADMGWIGDYYKPDIGILSAGGYYTMDMTLAAYAAKTYFDFKTVIPCHYRTFPALEQSAEKLASGLPGVDVIEPQVLQPITL
ncbi:metal-dependent hydrolase [Primorskyibacter sp. 2E107]|uniref:metal-dependent hydrolase n=1 Tax=Primorskyibacter sp. 2E107 TaxID=3403458 RepID=UPI003AF9E5B5